MSTKPAPDAGRRAGVYARISQDRAGDELGIRRQVSDCEKLATSRGFVVAATYIDNDASAFNGKSRPEYERLLRDVRDGRIDVVLAWHPDRLYRHPRDLEAFVETVEAADAGVATVQAGELDLSTASGRMVARMLGAAARYEGEHKAERQRRKHRELAEAGKPVGGGDRPFGFNEDRVTLRRDEAAEIRKAAKHILGGGSLRSLALDWRDRGVHTPRGGIWSKSSLRRMLMSARIAGLRSYRGQVISKASWPAIISPERHEALVAIFDDPSRRLKQPPRRYLLTGGLARCALCGSVMVARPNERGGRRYACAADNGGCNRTFQVADSLEDHVRDSVLAALDGPALQAMREQVAASDDDDGLVDQIAAIEARRREAVEAYGAGDLSLASFQQIDRDTEGRLADAHGRLAARSQSRVAASLPSSFDELRRWWVSADLDARRQVVALVIERVEIGPGVQGRNTFDPDRLRFVWRV